MRTPAEDLANTLIDECESTNDLARALGDAGHPHGTWISARRQTRGRGRLGRAWQSLEGNLFFSMIARPRHMEVWTWVPLATAVAVVRAVRALQPQTDLRIKWPNDLWIGTAKAGGILCEGVGSREQSFIVIGIGLNCVQAPDAASVDQQVFSLNEPRVDQLRARVHAELLAALSELEARGPEAVRTAYEAFAALSPGTSIVWDQGRKSGQVIGLGPSGELQIQTEAGETLALLAEDVSVRKKGV